MNLAIHDVECCETFQTHEELLEIVHAKMPDEDELYDLATLYVMNCQIHCPPLLYSFI